MALKRVAAAFVLALLAAFVLAGQASATPLKSRTARLGAVSATISWQPTRFMQARNVRLQITRDGRKGLEKRLGVVLPQAIKVRDLDGNGEAEVIVDLYTGGAHCCLFSRVYRYTGSTYSSLRHMWGDLSYRLNDLDHDGVLELVSADDRFAYVFTSYAGSAFPVQIWNYRAGRMGDVTRSYPAPITQDAAMLWKEYLRQRKTRYADPRGILAAWMADEYLLGRQARGWAKMRELNRKGEFKGYSGDEIWVKNGAYLTRLRKFLENHGYAG